MEGVPKPEAVWPLENMVISSNLAYQLTRNTTYLRRRDPHALKDTLSVPDIPSKTEHDDQA